MQQESKELGMQNKKNKKQKVLIEYKVKTGLYSESRLKDIDIGIVM